MAFDNYYNLGHGVKAFNKFLPSASGINLWSEHLVTASARLIFPFLFLLIYCYLLYESTAFS